MAVGSVKLTARIDRYIALRQTLGFKLHGTAPLLQAFARFAAARGDTHIRTSTAVARATEASLPSARHIRLRDVMHLARFLQAEDAVHEVPPATLFPAQKVRPLPYIYAPEEVAQIVATAGQLRQTYPLRRDVYTTLFGLIAATGLRVSEALDLRFDDLLPNDVLLIRRTKFGKSRLVPLHPTVANALGRYLDRRRRLALTDDHVFLSAGDRRIAASMVNYTVRRVVRLAGIATERTGPCRIHDLRHTFATRPLQQCSTRRKSVSRHCVSLATYMGHTDIVQTYWYLEATHDGYRHHRRGADGRGEQPMTPIAPLITAFLREHMPIERGYSPHTCETYAYAFGLLFLFASERLNQRPSQLCLDRAD